MDQPPSMKRAASQSSKAGCVGRAPLTPRSPGVATSPVPKWWAQIRFTITRAAKAPASPVMARAIATRREDSGASAVSSRPPKIAGMSGTTSSRRAVTSPLNSR